MNQACGACKLRPIAVIYLHAAEESRAYRLYWQLTVNMGCVQHIDSLQHAW